MKFLTMSPAQFHRRRMDLFNQFHRLRRFADDISFRDFDHMEGIIKLLTDIDNCTTLQMRFGLLNTNPGEQREILEAARKYRHAPCNMLCLLCFYHANNAAEKHVRNVEHEHSRLVTALNYHIVHSAHDGKRKDDVYSQMFFGSAPG
jgi:hypothetical protein